MKRINQYILIAVTGLLIVISGCQKDQYDLGDLVAPTDLQISYTIIGVDPDNPNGDGSGQVDFTAMANKAITYKFEFDDGKDPAIAGGGKVTHMFSINGLNSYNVKVSAIGTGGITTSQVATIEVFSSFSDPEAIQFLTGGSSKKWYWAADQTGHLGLGPNDMKYENGEHTYPAWYQAAPWEKVESTMYQDEFIFSTEDGVNVTFEHINPTGEAFIQGLYASELGLGDEGSHPFEFGGVKNVSFSPSNSIATVDGQYRGTTMNYSDGGFMGFYAGTSEYEIIEVTENVLRVRLVQANEPLYAWYHIFTNVKPEQQ